MNYCKKLILFALRLSSLFQHSNTFKPSLRKLTQQRRGNLEPSLRATKLRGNPFLLIILISLCLLTSIPSKAAIEFDGVDDYIAISNLDTNIITISAWVKRNRTNQSGNKDRIIVSVNNNGWGVLFASDGSGNADKLVFSKVGVSGITSTGSVVDLNWHHITVTYDGADVKFYIDGSLSSTHSYSVTFNNTGGNYTIASRGTGEYFQGKIDDVRIYNRALSSSEVEALYKSKRKRTGGSLAQGLVAHYEMDDDAVNEVVTSLKDESGNSKHGEFKNFNNVITAFNGDVPANIGTGKSLYFDGVNDNVKIASPSIGNLQSQGSVSIWFKPSTTLTSTSGGKYMFAKFYGPYIIYDYIDGKLTYIVYNSSNTEYSAGKTMNLNNNTWYHAVGVHTPTNIYFYLNGVLEDTQAVDMSSPKLNTGALSLGSQYDESAKFFPGKIDATHIYNKALTPSEISYLYNGSGMEPGTSNLQALWTFDDFRAVKDASGNSNHGVGSGGASLKYTEGILRR